MYIIIYMIYISYDMQLLYIYNDIDVQLPSFCRCWKRANRSSAAPSSQGMEGKESVKWWQVLQLWPESYQWLSTYDVLKTC